MNLVWDLSKLRQVSPKTVRKLAIVAPITSWFPGT